jgi:hypothetical protein
MVQRRAIFCGMVFQNELTFRLSSGNLATHISQCLGRSSVVPLVSQSRYSINSISRLFFRSFVEPAQREMDASDYRCSIPAEKEQEARS